MLRRSLQKIIARKRKAEEWRCKYLRLMADFKNYKKQLQRRSPIYILMQIEKIARLYGVLDNFEESAHDQ